MDDSKSLQQTITWRVFEGFEQLSPGWYLFLTDYGSTYLPYLYLHKVGKNAGGLRPSHISRLCSECPLSIEDYLSTEVSV